MLLALGDFGIDKITDEYNSGDIQEDLSKSIFVPLTKKPGSNELLEREVELDMI